MSKSGSSPRFFSARSIVRGGFGEGAGLLAARDGVENEGGEVFRDVVVGGAPGGMGIDAVGVLHGDGVDGQLVEGRVSVGGHDIEPVDLAGIDFGIELLAQVGGEGLPTLRGASFDEATVWPTGLTQVCTVQRKSRHSTEGPAMLRTGLLTAIEAALHAGSLLAAGLLQPLSENSRPGHQLSTFALYPGIGFVNSNTATGLRVCLYDDGRRSRAADMNGNMATSTIYRFTIAGAPSISAIAAAPGMINIAAIA